MTRRQPGAGARRLPGNRKSGVRPLGDSPSYGASASAVPVAPAGPGTPGAAAADGTGEPGALAGSTAACAQAARGAAGARGGPGGPGGAGAPEGAKVTGPELSGGADAPGTFPDRLE